jgi:hypothetical protein
MIGDLARAGGVVLVLLGQYAAHDRRAGAQHVHGMRRRGQLLQHRAHRRRQAAQVPEFRLVGRELRLVGQLAVDE